MYKKGFLAAAAAVVIAAGCWGYSGSGSAATAHFYDAAQGGASMAWTAWSARWPQTAADYTNVSIAPGADQTKLNFAWYSPAGAPTPVVYFGSGPSALKEFKGACAAVDAGLTGGAKYEYNHVTVSGLKENSTYYYAVVKNGVKTPLRKYKTGSFGDVKILFVGDPQIGASKGQTQDGKKLTADAGAANTAARNDGYAWTRTLEIASAQNPSLSFMISAGDQVNKTGKPKEEEYAAYLAPETLAGIAEASTIGNHDSLNPDYSYHFFAPNMTRYGSTKAGSDYYYTYGPALFIVLNTNNYNAAEHEKTIQEAVRSASRAKWRLVTIHQDIYGSGLDHSDSDGMILRTQLTPIFDKYKIDVVLQGHDHTYSRSKLLRGDGASHGSYEFRLQADGSDYDWDHAFNKSAGGAIPLAPDKNDAAGLAAKKAFDSDNRCYSAAQAGARTVTDPKGVLYMTANSASGSKFYELIPIQQDYIAKRSQNWLPSYSVIELTSSVFKIDTYQITPDGHPKKIDETFTIRKTK